MQYFSLSLSEIRLFDDYDDTMRSAAVGVNPFSSLNLVTGGIPT